MLMAENSLLFQWEAGIRPLSCITVSYWLRERHVCSVHACDSLLLLLLIIINNINIIIIVIVIICSIGINIMQ